MSFSIRPLVVNARKYKALADAFNWKEAQAGRGPIGRFTSCHLGKSLHALTSTRDITVITVYFTRLR